MSHIINHEKMKEYQVWLRKMMELAKSVASTNFGMVLSDDEAMFLAWKAEDAIDESLRKKPKPEFARCRECGRQIPNVVIERDRQVTCDACFSYHREGVGVVA